MTEPLVIALNRVTAADVASVGGKNASLGEMAGRLSAHGIRVPPGFATTARAYWLFIDQNRLREPLTATLSAFRAGKMSLAAAGGRARRMILSGRMPAELSAALGRSYRRLLPAGTGRPRMFRTANATGRRGGGAIRVSATGRR
jgi:pyruvate,water dikinase